MRTITRTAQKLRPDLFHLRNPPPEMQANIGRECYLRLVEGMTNPHGAQVDGVPVTPLWEHRNGVGHPTDKPRMFRVECLQLDYKGEACYRIYACNGDSFGRCAGRDEVIFTD
jgi:hypothetical protein